MPEGCVQSLHPEGRIWETQISLMMDQPEQSLAENIPELFQYCTHWARERRIWQLLDFAADGHSSRANMIKNAKPVLVVNGGEKAVEALRINK